MAKSLIPSHNTNHGSVEVLETALDKLDDKLEEAEQLAFQGLSSLALGIKNLFSDTGTPKTAANSFKMYSYLRFIFRIDRFTAEIVKAGLQEETYLNQVKDSQEAICYEKFKEEFDQISYAGRIATLLDEQPALQSLFAKLGFYQRFYNSTIKYRRRRILASLLL
jgi:hypothetical protein